MPNSLRARKVVVEPHFDVVDEQGKVIGEWTGAPIQVFPGHRTFPHVLIEEITKIVPKGKLESLGKET